MFLWRIGHEPLWLDETYTFAMVQHGLTEIVGLTAKDVHPPLYYLLLRLWTHLFGDSRVALRVPSALAAMGLVAHGAVSVRRIWSVRTGFLYALLVATSPGIVSFSQEARMYTLAAFFVTGAVLHGLLAMSDGRRRDLVWFGFFSWAASLTHYFGLVAAGVNCLSLLIMAGLRQRNRARPLALAALVAAVFYLPWLLPFTRQLATVSHGFWIPPTSMSLFRFGLVAPFAYKFEDLPYPWQANIALGIVAALLVATLVVKTWRGPAAAARARLHLLAVYGLTLGFGVLFSKAVAPVFMPRYMLVCAGLFLLIAATCACAIPRLGNGVVMGACLIGLGLPASHRIHTQIFGGPFAALAEQVALAGERAPVLLHNDVQALFPSWYAVNTGRHVLVAAQGTNPQPPGQDVYPAGRLAATDDVTALLSDISNVWIADAFPSEYHVDRARILNLPGWRQKGGTVDLDLPLSWLKMRLSHFERTGEASRRPGDD